MLLVALPRWFYGNRRGTLMSIIVDTVVGLSWEGMLSIQTPGDSKPIPVAALATLFRLVHIHHHSLQNKQRSICYKKMRQCTANKAHSTGSGFSHLTIEMHPSQLHLTLEASEPLATWSCKQRTHRAKAKNTRKQRTDAETSCNTQNGI